MDRVTDAFRRAPRAGFVPEGQQAMAKFDVPLPIGFGQTISQPSTVRQMLEWLDAEPRDTVLDIGSGSGWTTALLSRLVGSKGKVYAVELIPELLTFGRNNCARLGIKNVSFHQAAQAVGLPNHAPYDRILVSAAARQLPAELLDQLRVDGKLVIPVRSDILEITKLPDGGNDVATHPGYAFVPLVTDDMP